MSQTSFCAYGVRVLTDAGELIDLNDLSPLMAPTEVLLLDIAEAGGPRINPICIRKGAQNLPLASINGTPILCSFLCEETDSAHETLYLIKARRLELARLFTGIMKSNSPPSLQFGDNAIALRAIFLLFAAFETAQMFATSGYKCRTLNGYTFEAMHLRVSEQDGQVHFEIVANIASELRDGATIH